MDINSTNRLMFGKEFQLAEIQAARKEHQTGVEAAGRDKVELSSHFRDISRLEDLINAVPDIRAERVDEVRSAITGGTYNVKAEQVAEKIMGGDLLDEFF